MSEREHVAPKEMKLRSAVESEVLEMDERGEIVEEREAIEVSKEDQGEKEAERADRVGKLKDVISEETREITKVPTEKEISAYVEKNLPANFKSVSALTKFHMSVSRLMGGWWKMREGFNVEGKEHIPDYGPLLVVANHYRFADETRVRAVIDRPTYVAAADLHFEGSPVKKWLLEKMGFLRVESTLSGLNKEEKTALLNNVPAHERAYYQKVADRDEKPSLSAQRQFLRTVVALLAKGEPVTVFPEGLWLFEEGGKPEKKMRKAYSGIDVVAREYKKVTGKELPILPLAITDGGVEVLEVMNLSEGETIHKVMEEISKHLPEEERGYYKEA
jgi:1-acyl-sn-glycerol-3-phosphate acyltransferase